VIVKPQYFKKLHKHVSDLTGISQEMMDAGVPLPTAAENFKRFCGEDFVFLTWGPDDIPMLKDNFRVHDLPTEWLDRVYDLQVIFNRQTDGGTKQRSLEFAMEHFDIPQNLPAHDALNDAYFTALVAAKLDIQEGIRAYDASQGQYLESSVIGDADAGEDGYVTISEMLDDAVVSAPLCPICHKPLTAKGKPLHSKGQRYTFHFACEKDGDMLLSLKMHRNFNDTWRARRTVSEASEEQLAEFRRGIERTAIRRKVRKRKPRGPRRNAE
jgi:DNA polymerase III epsilon subunit-like protein